MSENLRFGAIWKHDDSGTEVVILGVTSKPDTPEKAEKYAQRVIYRYPDGRIWPRLLDDFLSHYSFAQKYSNTVAAYEVLVQNPTSQEYLCHTLEEARDRLLDYVHGSAEVNALYRLEDVWGAQN